VGSGVYVAQPGKPCAVFQIVSISVLNGAEIQIMGWFVADFFVLI
jgi:hypothetical protein